jgi:ABC-type branched-subunit amino acid transport system ATPase component
MDVTMMLDVHDLSAGYTSDADVLSAVDLDVAAGEIVVLDLSGVVLRLVRA